MKIPPTLLELGFEGYFMARIATDPDPTNEERGMSGYTMALPRENPLDQVIRLQVDEAFYRRNARAPLDELDIRIGVFVQSARFDGKPYAPAEQALVGAAVSLCGRDTWTDGAVFESRNNIVGSDDTMAFVIDPFQLRIARGDAQITAIDRLDPSDPSKQTWQFTDPAAYARRISTCQTSGDVEVQEAIEVWDGYGYFRDRRRYLDQRIAKATAEMAGATLARRAQLEADVQGWKSRIYQLETWGDRVTSKLGTRVDWEFDINGPQTARGDLGGTVVTEAPWHTRFWFGGWDGDLLIGYMRGTLAMPFVPGGTGGAR